MKSVVCTLFESHYHFGVAALVNSLYAQGFRGDFFAGYKGELPPWASAATTSGRWKEKDIRTLSPADGIEVHFIPLDTTYHLTNYKPDFILKLSSGFVPDYDAICYFDPDIILTAQWKFIEEWVTAGVALCEDVNSPLQEDHPRRSYWRKYFGQAGINLRFRSAIYVNGGFIGVTRNNIGFVQCWQEVQEQMAHSIGGLSQSAFTGMSREAKSPHAPFSKTDQDALNATIEYAREKVSLIGLEAMAFKPGACIIPHALGSPKPWHINYLSRIIAGTPPRVIDRKYWEFANGIIRTQSNLKVKIRNVLIKLNAVVSRFYSRR